MMDGLYLGLDLGGTKVAVAVGDDEGNLRGKAVQPTPQGDGEAVLAGLLGAADAACRDAGCRLDQVKAAGVGAPGPLDLGRGIVLKAPNLPSVSGFPLREKLAEGLKVPVFMDNDANVAALGEHRLGGGRGYRDLIYITVSTGVGGGLILGGQLYRGRGAAGEIGHLIVQIDGPLCSCGNHGCLEAVASGTAMAKAAEAELAAGEGKSSLLANGRPATGATVGEAAQAGDPLAGKLVARAGAFLGVALADLVNLLDPELILIGGGVSRLGDLLLDPARAEMAGRTLGGRTCPVRVAALGGMVGAVGALVLAMDGLAG